MAKKSKNTGGIVFSTNMDFDYEIEALESVGTLPPARQNLRRFTNSHDL